MDNRPVGIMDSGIGGLTVFSEIVKMLPEESTVYIGDSRNTPYGARTVEEIYEFAQQMIQFLLQKDAKVIVVACNTITVPCIDRLRKENPGIPIVGTVPVVKKAAELSTSKRIGILSTTQTAQSDYLSNLIEKFASDCTVFNHGTDTLVPFIEKGDLTSVEVVSALHRSLQKFLREDIDTLALGCTHFPFLKDKIGQMLGPKVQVLDSGSAIARQVQRILIHNVVQNNTKPTHAFYTTGNKDVMQSIVKKDVQTISL